MARDAAIVTTWGAGIPGREAKGLEVFMDAVTFWGKQAADGRCSQPGTRLTPAASSASHTMSAAETTPLTMPTPAAEAWNALPERHAEITRSKNAPEKQTRCQGRNRSAK